MNHSSRRGRRSYTRADAANGCLFSGTLRSLWYTEAQRTKLLGIEAELYSA